MEMELEPRVKALAYKVKAMSRESPAQKAAHVLDTDLRNHWSTGTNTKEWILLELDELLIVILPRRIVDAVLKFETVYVFNQVHHRFILVFMLVEPCLLSHIRIYNKSVLEWEISVGLRYKPETFVKVRPRCEAPRRDMMYQMNYTPCLYVRISCMRGNPIALFFIQLIGIPVPGLEPEFQPVANHLLPYIISHKEDGVDMHLQLLHDVTSRLARFLPHLETDLSSFSEAAEPTMRFLALLAGPLYPILQIVSERETARLALNISDYEASKTNLPSTALMVSSNFEPRRSRNTSSVFPPISMHLVFRPDAIFVLLRKAFKDSNLGNVCKMASRILMKLMGPIAIQEVSTLASDTTPFVADENSKSVPCDPIALPDYSNLFGEEFQIPDDFWDPAYLNVLDSAAVEEGIMHVLYASASQPLLCSKLAENTSKFWLALPLIQALLPALRPNVSGPYQIDENFFLWKQSFVQNALSQIVATSSSAIYCPLLRACAGYLASFSPSHAKTACVLIDLCSSVLAPWMAQVIAKVDLTVELLEDLLGVIQGARLSLSRARSALKYIILALSGNMDDTMAKYKDAKHRILFLLEMLEPFLDPSLTPLKGMIPFGNISSIFTENQEHNCALALDVIRTAIRKAAVLPSLEAEWRHGSVAPSVLLQVLDAQMQLPADIDNCKFSSSDNVEPQSSATLPPLNGVASSRSNNPETADAKVDVIDMNGKMDVSEDASLLFAPPELNRIPLIHVPADTDTKVSDSSRLNAGLEGNNNVIQKKIINQFPGGVDINAGQGIEFYNLLADYSQLLNYRDCELRASEFRRLALDLNSQNELSQESHDVAIDALLLAAECYINPCFMMSFKDISPEMSKIYPAYSSKNNGPAEMERIFRQKDNDLKLVADIERKRDRVVLEILIEAAELDRKYHTVASDGEVSGLYVEGDEDVISLSQQDIVSADAITLVRQNQALLCNFLIHRLQRDSQGGQHPRHEILMWCLLFLLHSATKLSCAPVHVVDIILYFAESLNVQLKSFYYHLKEGNAQMNHVKQHEVQRRWILLQRLVTASSGSDETSVLSINVKNGFRFSNLVPSLTWLQKVPGFSSSAFPMVRYFGWMAVARNAKQFLKERLFLVSDFSQLTHLLSIFSDDLSLVDSIIEQKGMDKRIEEPRVSRDITIENGGRFLGHRDGLQSFHALYPDISKFFPNLKNEFVAFGETILEAVGLQLKFLSSSVVPDLMCWFSDLCSCPFVQTENAQVSFQHKPDYYKGFVAKNAKAVILYILEAVVVEHMEAMVPEIPRVVQVLVSLCRTSYCDVSFLDSILCLLKPIIAYSLNMVSDEENSLADDSCDNFESLCFGELFSNIKYAHDSTGTPIEKGKFQALTIYVLATIFSDLSSHRKIELLQSTTVWAEFASVEGSNFCHDYICAYQVLMENCRDLLIATSRVWGIVPLKRSSHSDTSICSVDDLFNSSTWFLNDICNTSTSTECEVANASQKVCHLTVEEVKSFSKELEALISTLNPTLEQFWRLHHSLSKKLVLTSAECYVYARCLSLNAEKVSASSGDENLVSSEFADVFPESWRTSIRALSDMILVLQEKHCWEVASVLLDSLLGVPRCFHLDNVIDDICSALKNISTSAPNIFWRLQTDKMISLLLTRGIHNICKNEVPLVDLFCALLGHPEAEQRYIALKHLGRLVGQDVDGGRLFLSSTTGSMIASSDSLISASERILCPLVSAIWDNVALMASSDSSLLLRTHATALLISLIPFAEKSKLQLFLTAADSILQCLTTLAQPTCYGPLTQFSLALIASVCLYSPPEDLSLIPESIWRNIETFGMSRTDRYCTSLEKKVCEALCRVKNDGEQAKELLKEVLSSSSQKQQITEFATTRESILQVIGNLTSARSYLDFFSKEADQKIMELEEAEINMELLQREVPLSGASFDFQDWQKLPLMSTYAKEDHRLQQIKDGMRSIEKAKLREEIVARRQQKLLLRRARQQFLEEAALREAELIQNLDRERTNEAEKELERQQLLELEQAKTRELRHNLDIEKEKQVQASPRDLQRELEQVESGVRPSRREFASSTHSRARDRYRERENGRDTNEGTLRTSATRIQPDNVATTSTTGMFTGRGSFSGPLPTILQPRDRTDECGSSYEENFDGSRDSGDTGSVGDPDMVSALEGQNAGFGSGQRHGSRGGGKSRQIVERRERDRDGGGRREGKWERKH
ncbi:hypothetical protein PHJA_001536200 [Phtheirospermum japonicum]|uniref:Uncharacterized protein n=1 Tax=Phtheirospermum japonicum TaxID=374723 RepID=A0A830C4C7_9LAMI|nr:hypothetical protein PHJA_001536200 [Phtheirospermum japonicum]